MYRYVKENKNPRNNSTFRDPSGLYNSQPSVYTVRKSKNKNASLQQTSRRIADEKSVQWARM